MHGAPKEVYTSRKYWSTNEEEHDDERKYLQLEFKINFHLDQHMLSINEAMTKSGACLVKQMAPVTYYICYKNLFIILQFVTGAFEVYTSLGAPCTQNPR